MHSPCHPLWGRSVLSIAHTLMLRIGPLRQHAGAGLCILSPASWLYAFLGSIYNRLLSTL